MSYAVQLTFYFLPALILLNSVCIYSACNYNECCGDPGYYWREYDGVIPPDAIPGALDKAGDIIYIGQTIHPTEPHLIPGEIRRREKRMYYQYHGARSTTENIKIMCSQHPEFYQWVPTDIQTIGDLEKRKKIIVGGFEGIEVLFIGRGVNDGEQIIGKINSQYRIPEYRALYAASPGKDIQFRENFEVLAYNPGDIIKERAYNTAITVNFYKLSQINIDARKG